MERMQKTRDAAKEEYRQWKNAKEALFLTGLGLSVAGAVTELVAWGFYEDTPAVREATNQTAAIHNPDVDSEVDSTNWSTVVLIAAIASLAGAILVTLVNRLMMAEIQTIRRLCKSGWTQWIQDKAEAVRAWYWGILVAASALTALQIAVLVYASIGVDVGVANAAAFFGWTVSGAVIAIAGHFFFIGTAGYSVYSVVRICKKDTENPPLLTPGASMQDSPPPPPVGQSLPPPIGEAQMMGYARVTQVVDPNAPLRNRQFTTA